MSWLRFVEGRQGTGYQKMLLLTAAWPIPFDVYLLRYKPGAEIPWHTDPVPNKQHHRLNIFLKDADEGGEFFIKDEFMLPNISVQKFRPDIQTHRVSKVVAGTRYVLSIGWLT